MCSSRNCIQFYANQDSMNPLHFKKGQYSTKINIVNEGKKGKLIICAIYIAILENDGSDRTTQLPYRLHTHGLSVCWSNYILHTAVWWICLHIYRSAVWRFILTYACSISTYWRCRISTSQQLIRTASTRTRTQIIWYLFLLMYTIVVSLLVSSS